jgi:acyl CoA:acetate/3-ketoacid CoA transferase beta subunit
MMRSINHEKSLVLREVFDGVSIDDVRPAAEPAVAVHAQS